MKNYKVTIQLVVNPSRDVDDETPETKDVEFKVFASSENEAIRKAKNLETSSLSVWESYAEEDTEATELLQKLANATETYYECGGHGKAARNKESMEHWKNELISRGFSIPDKEILFEFGVFNGVGSQ